MFLCNYIEYGAENGLSMRDSFEKAPYNGIGEIIEYLKNVGTPTLVTTRLAKDRLTGKRIKGETSIYHLSDGKYSWCSDLAYHVDKYNLRLPKEFEDHVLEQYK